MFQISIYCHNITLLFYTFLLINYRKELSATEHDKREWKKNICPQDLSVVEKFVHYHIKK